MLQTTKLSQVLHISVYFDLNQFETELSQLKYQIDKSNKWVSMQVLHLLVKEGGGMYSLNNK